MNFYRKKTSEFAPLSADFYTYINTNYAALNLVLAQATAYGALNTTFQTAYSVATNPATRTSAAITARNTARKPLDAMAKQLSDYIIGNPNVPNATLQLLGLDPRRTNTPVPPPTDTPTVKILSVVGWTVKASLAPMTPEAVRGKPKGTEGIAVFSHIGAAPPTDISEWVFEANTGRTVIDLAFSDTLPAGTKVWITAFYYNSRKQSGPSAVPVSTSLLAGTVGNKMAA